jgi:hypothetical protein
MEQERRKQLAQEFGLDASIYGLSIISVAEYALMDGLSSVMHGQKLLREELAKLHDAKSS